MNRSQLKLAAILLLCAPSVLGAQSRTTVLLDPAHGGGDPGAILAGSLPEKQVTLALSSRLRTALAAQNFNVVATRDNDTTTLADPDLRAGIANHARAIVCLVLHATGSGSGVHLYTSNLEAPDSPGPPPIPWTTAQAGYVTESQHLANRLGLGLLADHVAALVSSASIRPLDNLTCPAVLVELAPLNNPGASPTSPSDAAYQQRVAGAIAKSLVTWREGLLSTTPRASANTDAGSQP